MAVTLMKHIVIFVFLCGVANCLMELPIFDKLIKPRCYNKTNNDNYLLNGQRIPLSNSMETLIGLLESFERNYTYTPVQVAEKFLRRFRIDGLKRLLDARNRVYSFQESSDEKIRKTTLEAFLFDSPVRDYSFPEEAFTEDEKCALYYMMSHALVNCTRDVTSPIHSTKSCVVEQGVVSLYDHEIHAIAPSRLLLGILAGLKNLREISIKDILPKVQYRQIDLLDEDQKNLLQVLIDPVYAVTVGDVVVEEIRRVESEENSRKFGPNGKWNSTLCPTRYYLESKDKPTKATYAELRGAGDGLLLGLIAKKLKLNGHKITISSMLRMYYSQHGVNMPGEGKKYSYCNRYDHWTTFDREIREQIQSYAELLSITRSVVSNVHISLKDQVNSAMTAFENSRRDIVESVTDESRCKEYDPNPCEKEANIFVVMDNRGNEDDVENTQKEIISNLTTHLDIGLSRGSMTVMTSTRGYGDRQLENIIFNSTLKGCVGCLVDWVVPQGRSEDEVYVFQSINKTLMHYEAVSQTSPGVPVKVLIYFNYADAPSRDDRNLKNALWDVHNKHRDVPVFAIGKSQDLLKKFATDDDNVFASEDSIIETLNEKICESFSTFQYPECRKQKSSMDDTNFEGYITPDHIQYWAMYPEYFLKSFNIKFAFHAEGGQITVCHSRDSRKEKLNRHCKDTSGNDKERKVEFTMSNPCKGKNEYNCPPFYFSIMGKEIDSGMVCKEKECKYLDQIKFTVRHEGVSCNSSSSLISSLQVIIALVLFCVIRKNI